MSNTVREMRCAMVIFFGAEDLRESVTDELLTTIKSANTLWFKISQDCNHYKTPNVEIECLSMGPLDKATQNSLRSIHSRYSDPDDHITSDTCLEWRAEHDYQSHKAESLRMQSKREWLEELQEKHKKQAIIINALEEEFEFDLPF